jgi:hypothetical protein
MWNYTSPALRDRFIQSIDLGDWTRSGEFARDLLGSINPLPGLTCDQLALPRGSTYGAAAERVRALGKTE